MQAIIDGFYAALIEKGRWRLYLDGLAVTLQITAVACIIGVLLGMIIAIIKVYAVGSKNPIMKVLNILCDLYTTIVRGTPVTVQLFILYFGIFISSGNLMVCFVGFGLNSAAYVSEIFRSGINSVDSGQMEAGRSLGLSRNQTMKSVILPQATKNVLPAIFNEIISLLKETSVAGYIAGSDITKVSSGISGRTFTIYPMLIAAIFYLTMVIILTMVQKKVEKRFSLSDRS